MQDIVAEALEVGNFELVSELVQNPEYVFASLRIGPNKYTPLHYACKHGNTAFVRAVIAACPLEAVQATFHTKPTPADVAIENGHKDLQQLLASLFLYEEDKAIAAPAKEPLYTKLQCPHEEDKVTPASVAEPLCTKPQPNKLDARLESTDTYSEQSTNVSADVTLHNACKKGDLLTVRSHVSNGLSPNLPDEDELLPLHIAAKYGHCELIQFLVRDCHCDVNIANTSCGMTAIHYASSGGHLDAVKLLVHCNAKWEARDSQERTSLHLAAQEGHLSIVKFFVHETKMGGTELKDLQGNTALKLAKEGGKNEIVQYLLDTKEHDGDVHEVDSTNGSMDNLSERIVECTVSRAMASREHGSEGGLQGFHEQLQRDKEDTSHNNERPLSDLSGHQGTLLEGFSELIGRRGGQKSGNKSGSGLAGSPLHTACMKGDLQMVKRLINSQSCDINAQDNNVKTPVLLAAYFGHTDLVRFLCSLNDCDMTKADSFGRTPLHHACQKGHVDVVSVLVCEKKCNVFLPDNEGVLPVHIAAFEGYIDIVQILAGQKNSNVHQADHKGRNALHRAAQEGHLHVVKFLVTECHVDPNAQELVNGCAPLHFAVAKGHQRIVEYLLTQPHCDAQAIDESGRTVLHRAAEYDQLSIVKLLNEKYNCSCATQDFELNTPLHAAAFVGNLEIVKYLTSQSEVVPDVCNLKGRTAIHFAAQSGHLNVIQFLVEEMKWDAFLQDEAHGVTALHLAANNGHLDIVEFLCSLCTTKSDEQDNHGRTPLYYATQEGHVETVKYLISHENCDRYMIDHTGITPEMLATNSNRSDIIAAYAVSENKNAEKMVGQNLLTQDQLKSAQSVAVLECVAEGNLKKLKDLIAMHGLQVCQSLGPQGGTMLHMAALSGCLEIADYLVKECGLGSCINTEDQEGRTPLHNAAHQGHLSVLHFLASQKGCMKDSIDRKQRTPLHYACQNGHYNLAVCLVSVYHCPINIHDKEGATPFQVAAFVGHLNLVQFLSKIEGCDRDSCDNKRRTALHCACQEGHFEIVKFLVQDCQCNYNAVEEEHGLTPLHLAATSGHFQIVKYLCSLSACNPDACDKHGRTPLLYASMHNHLDVVQYLATEKQCNVTIKDELGVTPIKAATFAVVIKFLEEHIARCANERKVHSDHTTPQNASTGASAVDGLSSKMGFETASTDQLLLHMYVESGNLEKLKVALASTECDAINARGPGGESLLHNACIAGHCNIVQYLVVEKNFDINILDKEGRSLLHYAAYKGHADIVDMLASRSAELVSQCDIRGRTALHDAAQNGHLNVVTTLVKYHKCNCDMADRTGVVPLHLAAGNGHIDVIQFLIKEGGANPQLTNTDGETVLHIASRYGQLEAAKYLVMNLSASPMKKDSKHGASALHLAANFGHYDLVRYMCDQPSFVPNMIDHHGQTALHYACQEGHLKIVECLIKHGCQKDVKDDKGITPVEIAAMVGKTDVVLYLQSINNQTNPVQDANASAATIISLAAEGNLIKLEELMAVSRCLDTKLVGPKGETPLHVSANQGHLPVVQYFVKLGYDLNSKDIDGDTPLHCAAQNGHHPVVSFLLTQNVMDANIVNKNLRLPLHCASVEGYPNVVEALLLHTANKDAKDVQGSTPLLLAAYFGQLANFKLLLEAGCEPGCTDTDGRNALHLACQEKHAEIVKVLIEKTGILLCVRDSSHGSTPYHFAANKGSVEIMQLLCTHPQSNPNLEDHNGRTPLHYASQNGHIELVRLLTTKYQSDAMAKDKKKVTPLSLSAESGHLLVLKYLCSLANSDPGFSDGHGRTPLHYACQEGHMDIVQYLIGGQAGRLDQKDDNGVTPMDLLSEMNHARILDYLKQRGRQGSVKSSNHINNLNTSRESKTCISSSDDSALLLHASQGALPSLKVALSKNPSSVNVRGPKGETLLHCASLLGHLDVAQFLVNDCHVDINSKDNDSHTPLFIAAHEGQVSLLQFLTSRGADLHRKDILGREPLHYASQNGHLNCVKALVKEYSCDVNVADKTGVTPIQLAAERGNVDVFQFLLRESNADHTLKNDTGRSPLHYASQKGCLPIVETLLVECKVNCMEIDLAHGVTALHLAASNGHLDVVKLLSAQPNCECDFLDFHEHTPLYYAILEDHFSVAQYLVEEMKCNPSIKDSNGTSPLSVAKSRGRSNFVDLLSKRGSNQIKDSNVNNSTSSSSSIEQVHNSVSVFGDVEHGEEVSIYLLAQASNGNLLQLKEAIENIPAAVNVIGRNGETLLHIASFAGHLPVVEYLVTELHSDVNFKDDNGQTPVHNAAHEGHTAVLNFLGSQPNCNINANNNIRRLPLHYGTQNGHFAVVKLLVEKYKCDVNAEDKTGVTPFQLAAEACHFDVFEYCLLTGKGNILHQDRNGRNVLHCASQQGSVQIVKLLLQQCKAEVTVKDKVLGVTALHLAAGCDHLDVVKLMCSVIKKNLPSTCDVLDNHGRTPLHYACQDGAICSVQYLISEQQCNPHLQDQNGITPFHLATLKSYTEIVDYIKFHCGNTNGGGSAVGTAFGNDKQPLSPGKASIKTILPEQPKELAARLLVVRGSFTELKQLVHQHGTSILKQKGSQGESVLHNAAAAGHLEIVQYLVQECGLSVNEQDEDGHIPLHNAVHDGNTNVVRFLMGYNDCNINSKDKSGRMPIHYGAQNGHFDSIKVLVLEGKCSYASGDDNGRTPLHLAAFNGHKMIVTFLLSQKNTRADVCDKNGRTPLHCASLGGHTDVAQYLITEHNADVTIRDLEHKITALHLAASNGHLDIVKLLCAHPKCEPDAVEQRGRSSLHCACAAGHVSIVKYLVTEKNCDLNRKDGVGLSPVEVVAKQGNVELIDFFKQTGKSSGRVSDLSVEQLGMLNQGMQQTKECGERELAFHKHAMEGDLEKLKEDIQAGGAKMVNCKGLSGQRVIHNATEAGHFVIVQYLIKEHSCDVNVKDDSGCTPLHLAAHGGYVLIAELLVSLPVCFVDPEDMYGRTPLHYAAKNGHLNVVQLLVEKAKCNVLAIDEKKITPFHLAAGNGRLDVVKFLCSKGCNPHLVDKSGRAGIHYASQDGKLDVINYLVTQQKSSCVSRDLDHGVTPIHLAAAKGYSDILSFFGSQNECKDAMDRKDNHGRTPLHYACQNGCHDATMLLFKKYSCDPLAKDLLGATPIDLAEHSGNSGIARFLKGGEEVICSKYG